MLVPLVVRPDGEAFELVAGFHRLAAARLLEFAEVPVGVRDAEPEEADRAVENIARKQLNPYEEAKAVRAMLRSALAARRPTAVSAAAPSGPSSVGPRETTDRNPYTEQM